METITETAIHADEGTLRLERRLAAPRALVFAAWTEPRHLRRWSAPHGFEIPESDGELRVGGAWRATMRAADGTEYRLVGTYREIVPPEPEGFSVSVNVEDPDEGRRIFDALAEGGIVKMPFEPTFWAKGFGMLVDRYEIPWMVNAQDQA